MSASLAKGIVFALAATTIVTVTDAAADDKTSSSGSAALSALPSGKVPSPPQIKAPAAIPGSEKLAGFFIAPRSGRAGDYVSLTASAKIAKQVNDGTRADPFGDACFTDDQRNFRGFEEGVELTWRPNLESSLTLSTLPQSGGSRVTAVHSERIAEDGGRVTLEIVDAWVDPASRGVRLISKSTVPLELVSTIINASKVYAARDGANVHVVLVNAKEKKPVRTRQEGLFAIANGTVSNSSCDHITAMLKSEKGQGQSASFISTIELPSIDKEPPAEGLLDPASNQKLKLPQRPEVRVRPIHVHASLTWPTREKEPLLTVSAGWDARERTAIVF